MIDRMLTPTAEEARRTLTLEGSYVIATCRAVLARRRRTLVNVRLTMFACTHYVHIPVIHTHTRPARIAQTLLVEQSVHTQAILARVGYA
jgi:hypothetical protein